MPSTYTINLGIEKPATGEQSGTWGDTTNINFDILDQAINGAISITLASAGTSGSPNTLAISDGAVSDGRNKWIEFNDGGDLGATAYVQLTPNDAEKIVFIRNSLSGSRSVILFQGTYDAARDLEVPAGVDMVVKFSGGGATATATDVFTRLRVTAIETPSLTATTADINGGTIDGATVGASSASTGAFTTLTASTSLNIAASTTVDGVLDEDNMASDSATKLATQQSIKAYVDSKVGTVDTLAEILTNGNTSGANNLIIDNGQAITTNTVNETTAGSGVTIDSVLLKDDSVNATTLEVTNIKANDGTAAGSIANSTGAVTITSFISNSVDIGGGAIDDTVIGGSTPAAINGTTISATGVVTVSAGAVGAPSIISTTGTADTGQWFPAADTIAWSTAGSERMRIDSAGQVGIGVASPSVLLDLASNVQATALFSSYANSASGKIEIRRATGTITSPSIVSNGQTVGQYGFSAYDGTGFVEAARIRAEVDGTPGANDMPGRLVFYTTADGASSTTERMRIDSAGQVGIGGTPSARVLAVAKSITGGTSAYGVVTNGTVQSDVTAAVELYRTTLNTAAASFTCNNASHYLAAQGTFGAGSAVTSQYGFSATSSLTGATNNYGFYGDIASGTNRWNFYANGTANNYMAGSLGIGSTSLTGVNLMVNKNITGAVTSQGIFSQGAVQSDVTSDARYFQSTASTQNAVFTLTNLAHYSAFQGTFGASSTVTNQYGVIIGSLTGATNNYGFYGNIAAGTGRWNFYAAGTADNYFNGRVLIKTTSNNGGLVEMGGTGASSGVNGFGISQYQSVPSSVTGDYYYNTTTAATPATAFTLSVLRHYNAGQGTFGAGSSVTEQTGFRVAATLIGATTNYGFYSGIPSGTGRWNFYAAGTASNYMAGDLLLGTTTPATATPKLDILDSGGIQMLLTDSATDGGTKTARFGVRHYTNAEQPFGFFLSSSATANVLSYGGGSSSLNTATRHSFYTADNNTTTTGTERMRIDSAGSVGIGTTSLTGYNLHVNKSITGATTSYGIVSQGEVQSDVTSNARYFQSTSSTQAAVFTLTSLGHYTAFQGTFGASSTVTNQYGFLAGTSLTGATNNYGFYSDIASGTGRWNLYMNGTASNYMAGSLGIGTNAPTTKLYVNGDATISTVLSVREAIDLADNDILRFGTGDDWEMFHDGTNNYMDLNVGNLYIRDTTTTRFTFARTTGDFTATGNVTAYSDERLKKDWVTLPENFVERLSKVKAGTYTRTDTGERQAGASAQDWKELLPEVVTTAMDEAEMLSLAYGNAALVSAVELAKTVVALKAELESLKIEVAALKGK